MARTVIPITQRTRSGPLDAVALEVPAHVTDGARFANNGQTYLEIHNTGAGPHNITFQTPRTVEGLAVAEYSIAVAAGKRTAPLGPFDTSTFNQQGADRGYVYVDVDGTGTEVSFLAFV